jgi:hypothetical protein
MKLFKRISLSIVVVIPLAWIGLTIYMLSKMSITEIIVCTIDKDAYRIPQSICEWTLVNYRGTPEDLDDLDKNSGLSFVIEDEKLLRFFIAKGAPVNKRNHQGYTPLHSAIIQNLPGSVKILVEHGADKNLKDKDGRTPLELGKLMKVTPPIEAMKLLE